MPSSVQTVNLAGEPLSTGLVNELYQQENVQRVFDLYGPSEDTTYSTWTLRSAEAPATIGRPIANEKLYVLDPDLQPVPVGVAAELYIGGQGLARGYLKRPELTAEKFVPDPFSGQAGARLYRTGDRVRYRRDGNLEYLGRTDHQVKVRGFRIELGEIQTALEQHPAIQQSAVMVVERGDGDKRLVAYVMFQAGNKPTRSELAAFLREKLPGYMVPSYFVPLERFPLNQNGKLDCQALPKPELSEETTYTPPRNTWERKIAQCWKEVLGIERIGVKETFFDLGGHSMLLPRLNTRLEQALNCSIPILVLFQHPTIESLARYFSGTTKMFGPDGATSRENLRQGIARLGRLLETSKTGQ
jgi:acyl carrier protein